VLPRRSRSPRTCLLLLPPLLLLLSPLILLLSPLILLLSADPW
jgi:hypothetical protein